ncbi:restriction endonuclease subunit S [Acinetobacter genomosp. 15BJ]|uniref:Restriction endonuclease subunit S n=1 Tax=Acinetobacter genomosp. 15BJ TaxID=106651 RepID=A0ABT8UVI5_9GAMM|nr:restriction endonuclease subunit S [Acinetobacter genomosp. 15BJ]MDO3657059.1 restriction endonuclease subunit S [Acinetobacter genomosp. 15BJ]
MYQKYDVYKDSGLHWLGVIPDNWKIIKNKFLFNEINLRSFKSEHELLSVSQYTGVTKKSERIEVNEFLTNSNSLDGYKVVSKGDLVSNIMLAWNGSLGVSSYDGIVSPAYAVYRLVNNCCKEYFHYLLRTDLYKAEYKRQSTGVIESRLRLYTENFYAISSILPPLKDQQIISNFLKLKEMQIDQAIAIKEQQIALLNERKQIVIQQAVTKGLDPNVKMKDSGLEWIGKIPEHWQLSKLRYLGVTQNGISAGSEYFGSGYPFVSYGDVYKNRQLPLVVDGLAKSSIADQKNYSVLEGDVFFTRTSETVDEIGFASICYQTIEKATFAGFLIRFRPTNANYITKEFSKYYFNAQMMRTYFVKEMNLVIRASLSQELLKNLIVLLPSIDEQKAIASYLDRQMDAINELIGLQMSAIQKLKEYKTTLINDAVTGKIKVA